MIDKKDLRLGNMFEQGIVWKISGRAGAKVHLHGKGKWYKGFRTEVDVEKLTPIVLTPAILVEWCGFEKKGLSYKKSWDLTEHLIFTDRMEIGAGLLCSFKHAPDIMGVGEVCIGSINYLHELQNLWKILSKQELEIRE